MLPFDAVVFDMDGTLADTIPDLLAVFNPILAVHGVAGLTRESIVSHFGPTEEGILARLLPGVAAADITAAIVAELAERGPIEPFAGMRAVVGACRRAGVKVGVFTGAGRLFGASRLARMNLCPVDAFVAGDDVPEPKPHPHGFLELCRRLGVPAARTVFIGDSPLDLQCARHAGAGAVAVTWGVHGRAALAAEAPAALVDTPAELAAFLRLPPRSLVLFDLDGTLIDSASWLLASVNRVLAPYLDRPWTVADLVRTAGGPEHGVFAELVPPPALAQVLDAYQKALVSGEGFNVQQGIDDMLARLEAAGSEPGIFSGAGRALGELRLRHAGWAGRFRVRVWGDETAPKPAPDGIIEALRRAGASADAAVYVGDTEKDRDAARAAGVRFLGVTWGDLPGGPAGSELYQTPAALLARLLNR